MTILLIKNFNNNQWKYLVLAAWKSLNINGGVSYEKTFYLKNFDSYAFGISFK